MRALRFVHFGGDGAGDDIARSEFLGFVIALHETFEIDVAEDATFTAEGFTEKETRGALDGQGGGMELDELHIGENGAGFVGDGHAVSRGDFGIGGFAIELAEAASGEEDGTGADFVEGVIGFIEEANADGAAVFQD